ncbi:putative adhesin [Isoptericola sp. CG 20/1183]|uniref:Adhesin n=1 Tax=Isoptericola halotolerans TaxID=300560 RepID=A0ABX5EEX4_9MICO|nr:MULTISPECIES: DUF4097 family beta strand repeat-containing protein [Isoptericola]MCK0116132.1 DUF4097 family beta strand repeat-containing protein [Isoptericola sp. S6320L]PRZ04885.1 putative adhesin [Isoptericola halotolerans]PRZ05376.1 putative adhesin [Isoptericola sp. CG 20/1183]
MTSESWAVAAPQTLDLGGVSAASLRLQDGRADVVVDPAATRTTLEIVEVGKKPLQVVHEGGRLRVAYERSRVEAFVARVKSLGDSDRAVVRLTVPPGVSVDVGTTEADVDVAGTTGTVVKTVTGAIRTSGTHGSLYLRSVSGDVAASGHAGDVSAHVVSGALAVDGALGRVSAGTVSGAVAVTATGTAPMVTAKTVSGDVALRLDPGTPVSLKVRGAAGQVVLDGEVQASAARTLSVDRSAAGEGSVAYLTANVTSARVIVSRA